MGSCAGCRPRCRKPGVPRGSFHVDKGHLETRDLLTCCGHTAPLTRCIPAGVLRSEWPSRVLVISSSGAGFGTPRPRDARSSAGFSQARGIAPQRVTLWRARGRRCSWAAPPAEGRARNVASSGVFVTVMQPVTQDGVQSCRCGRFHCSSRSLLLLGS